MRTLLALVVLLVALLPESAEAQNAGWADLLRPGREDAARDIRDGLRYLVAGLGPRQLDGLDNPAFVQLESALLRFEQARPFFEHDPDLAYYTAVALTRWRRPAREGGEELRAEDALAAWQRMRELAPTYMPSRVAFEMATLHGRLGAVERSTAEYEAAIQLSTPDGAWLMGRTYQQERWEERLAFLYVNPPVETIHGNLAENRMHLGQLDEALVHYRAAMQASRSPFSRALSQWGLALAQARHGDHDAALVSARSAIEGDPLAADMRYENLRAQFGSMAVLHHPDVFFEPAYEVHAYHALGYEAYAAMPDHDGSRRRVLSLALQSWRRHLVEGGTSSRYGPSARAAVERLESVVAELPEDPTSNAPPWAGSPRSSRWAPRDVPWLPLNLP